MKLKFVIVGCGRIAKRHAVHIQNNGELIAVCDIKKENADELAEETGTRAYYDIDKLLDAENEIDVVAICSPNGLHAQHTIKSLRKGFHVLCEKPMAINVHDCGEMIKEAEKANRRLFIVKQNRFNPPMVAVKELIEKDKLGDILSIQLNCFWNRNEAYYENSWKGTKDLDGGTLYTQFSHFIDLLYWVVGDVKEVSAYGGNLNHEGTIEFEDTGVICLKFHNNALGTINYTVNSYDGNMEGSLTIFGTKGTVKIGGQYLNELEYQNIQDFKIENLPVGNPPNSYGKYTGSMSNHDKVYENIVDVLLNKGSIATNGFEGLKTVEIIDKIYHKIAQNGQT
ncbi:MAG: oxidoreductase [Flavobacteriales bacterium]|nr:MAG: oxidoreductase [Flavobacteriales bacterium]